MTVSAASYNRPLRVMWIWHAAVVAEYQKPLSALGNYPDLDLTLIVPKRWPERGGQMVSAEDPGNVSYRLVKARTLFTGFYYIYFFPSLLYQLWRYRPDIIYCYEEAHTFMAVFVLTLRRLFLPESRVLLYAAQNIKKRYPLPFRLFESYSFRHTDGILACGTRVAETLRSKGYRRLLKVVALPTDSCAFSPDRERGRQARLDLAIPQDALVIGYAGKLVEEKGLRTFWWAFAQLACERGDIHLALAGGGPLMQEIQVLACEAGLQGQVHLPGVIHNSALPAFINALDIFVLPSETRPNWREQFGRVAVEAMSCGVPVVGSDSGEIPTVLGDAGLIFHEGDSAALLEQLRRLIDPAQRAYFAGKGRQRVLSLFTTGWVAAQHRALYERIRPASYELRIGGKQ
ncbi:MAG: glycosyltransferase [Chloroflexi bacterium]|nr:glycosyltransferase [Chloroflexota bacterium]